MLSPMKILVVTESRRWTANSDKVAKSRVIMKMRFTIYRRDHQRNWTWLRPEQSCDSFNSLFAVDFAHREFFFIFIGKFSASTEKKSANSHDRNKKNIFRVFHMPRLELNWRNFLAVHDQHSLLRERDSMFHWATTNQRLEIFFALRSLDSALSSWTFSRNESIDIQCSMSSRKMPQKVCKFIQQWSE